MDEVILTKSEQRCFDVLLDKSGTVTSRDEIAQSVWGDRWLEKYSDWQIDRLIYLLRKKISSGYVIKTLRNSGYILSKKGLSIPDMRPPVVLGTIASSKYFEYMNNINNKRKVLKDLFKAINSKLTAKNILVINSYSFDNVDAVVSMFPNSTCYFSNFDKRALKLHQDRIDELKINNCYTVFEDIRHSILKNNLFDLVINDFRLNFNQTDKQNIATVNNMFRILKPKSKALVSVVIDPRDEAKKYGKKPWKFSAEEGLVRNCFTVPYYKQLFKNSGFKIVKEFDTQNGKKWHPAYRRFLLQK